MKAIYSSTPTLWTDGLPVGNGRLAAMLWGGPQQDIISLNHEWIWTGNFKERRNQKSARLLPAVREYLKNGEFFRANALAAVAFGGNGGISPLERRMDSYQPAGDIVLTYAEEASSIERILELEDGEAVSIKKFGKRSVQCIAYCDCVRDIGVFRWESTAVFDCAISFFRQEQPGVKTATVYRGDGFSFTCDMGQGVSFAVRSRIETDGAVSAGESGITIKGATKIRVLVDIGTEHRGIELELDESKMAGYSYHEDRTAHRERFRLKMNRSRIEFCGERAEPLCEPLNEYIDALRRTGKTDPRVISLYARFGVYLLVAGSICGELPLNLQGKWNHDIAPKWNSDYHLNINLQMNYWFSDRLNFPEYSKMMTDYLETIIPKAQQAAADLYDCRGILFPLNSDIWANSTAEAYNYAVWVGAAGWLGLHFMNYYRHTGDTEYLKNHAYPFFKKTAIFYEDYLRPDEHGTAQISPSQSPENRFEGGGYFPVSVCTSAAMDVQIAYDALSYAIEAAEVLGTDEYERENWRRLRAALPPFRIGQDGRLLEWDSDERRELEPGHRHLSHLYGVYPSSIFCEESRAEALAAARKSLDFRLANQSGQTGWSRAWAACLFARFSDGEKVQENLSRLITEISSGTLLDLHPDYYPATEGQKRKDDPLLFSPPAKSAPMIFQIDGNMGGSAAVAEALVQYHDGKICMFPARPNEWQQGRAEGIIMPGGHALSFYWENGRITELSLTLGYEGRAVFAPCPEMGLLEEIVVSGVAGSAAVIIKSGQGV